MKINTIQLSIVMVSLVLVAFAGVQYQANNRKMDIQEKQNKEEQKQETNRQTLLSLCISEAEKDYFDYAKLNGRENDDGTVWALTSVWTKAQARKDAAVKICEMKYGK
jgi:hypothetical protein